MAASHNLVFSCSIDDGHPSDMKAAALLHRHGIAATFYVPGRNREGAPVLPKAAVRELAQAFEIGSHTADHCFLKPLEAAHARFQIEEGKKLLEDQLGRQVEGFCYPGGKYRPIHADMVRQAGFAYARSTVNLCFDSGLECYEMPTTLQFYPHERHIYLRNFLRGGAWNKRRTGLKLALRQQSWMARLHDMFDHASQHGGVFHLWGHSKDIDELNAWQDFDAFLRHVAERSRPEQRLTNAELAQRTAREMHAD